MPLSEYRNAPCRADLDRIVFVCLPDRANLGKRRASRENLAPADVRFSRVFTTNLGPRHDDWRLVADSRSVDARSPRGHRQRWRNARAAHRRRFEDPNPSGANGRRENIRLQLLDGTKQCDAPRQFFRSPKAAFQSRVARVWKRSHTLFIEAGYRGERSKTSDRDSCSQLGAPLSRIPRLHSTKTSRRAQTL